MSQWNPNVDLLEVRKQHTDIYLSHFLDLNTLCSLLSTFFFCVILFYDDQGTTPFFCCSAIQFCCQFNI